MVELTMFQKSEILRWRKDLGLSPERISKEMDIPLEDVNKVLATFVEKKVLPPELGAIKVEITPELLDHLATFEISVNMDEWIALYLKASKSLGKVLAEPTATHLWSRFRDVGLLRTWALLDKENREIISTMLTMWIAAWKGSSSPPEKWRRVVPTLGFTESEAVKIPPFVPSVSAEEIPMYTPAFLSTVKEAWNTKTTKTYWEWIIEPTIGGVNVTLRGAKVPHEFFPHHVIERMVYDETRKVYVVRGW